MAKAKPKRLACRFCGETWARQDAENVKHSHPAVCPHRQDRVPALNGVHVGDLWRNLHTGHVIRIEQIRLGGAGTYVDREPIVDGPTVYERCNDESRLDVLLEPTVDELATAEPVREPYGSMGGWPLWSLVEHWEPLTRPDDYPVPWEMEQRGGFKPMRSTVDPYRCPGLRGSTWSEDKGKQYWHAWHVSDGKHCTSNWEWWQIDPDAQPELLPKPPPFPDEPVPMPAPRPKPRGVGFQMESHHSRDDADAWEPMQDGKGGHVWKPRKTAREAIAKCCEWTGWLFVPAMQVRDLSTGQVVWRRTTDHDVVAGPDIEHPDEPTRTSAAVSEPEPEQAALF